MTCAAFALPALPQARPAIFAELAHRTAPRARVTVSQFADRDRILSTKQSSQPGRWSTATNELLREPMDALSRHSQVHEVALMFPIQLGKTEVAINFVGYTMVENPGPLMVCLPGEVSLNKWVAQKLHPMIEESPAVAATLTSVASREASNTRTFKDYAGGQLFIEHAGSPQRLKSTSARDLVVDEFDEFAANLTSGDDPTEMLDGRTSAFPSTYKRLYISSPQIKGASRIEAKWLISDQRRRYLPCPHCGHMQHLQWEGLKWSERHPVHGRRAWYVCQECGCEIDEKHKPDMLAKAEWRATNPGGRIRGYHANCLYYPIGLGPRWADLVEMWLDAQGDPAKLKTFRNDRLAETHEDETTRRVRHEALADRAEHYALRTAPAGVLAITAGVDTQDNRLAVCLVGWGRKRALWVLDYVELPGDPAGDEVWHALAAYLTQPIQAEGGGLLYCEGFAQDAAGHKTEDVKAFVRRARSLGVRRPMCIFGATQNNAPPLSKPKQADVNWRGQTDRGGITYYHVGTVELKKWLFSRMSLDAQHDEEHQQALRTEEGASRAEGRATRPVQPPERLCHFSADLPEMFFPGITSEVFNPSKNRYEKKRGVRNEPLDTLVYATAATYHPELRLHRATEADWTMREARLHAMRQAATHAVDAVVQAATQGAAQQAAQAGEAEAALAEATAAPQGDPDVVWKELLKLRAKGARRGR